jgi:hypothetical protein
VGGCAGWRTRERVWPENLESSLSGRLFRAKSSSQGGSQASGVGIANSAGRCGNWPAIHCGLPGQESGPSVARMAIGRRVQQGSSAVVGSPLAWWHCRALGSGDIPRRQRARACPLHADAHEKAQFAIPSPQSGSRPRSASTRDFRCDPPLTALRPIATSSIQC